MTKNWIAVASAEHVRRGRAAGFMQVCHGKAAPLRRIRPGDRVVYYSPTVAFQGPEKLQAFTAIGIVKAGEPYQFDMSGGICPVRRDVEWIDAHEAPIRPLIDALEFSASKRNWGYQFRTGLFPVSDRDMEKIAEAMGVKPLPACYRLALARHSCRMAARV